MQIILTNTTMRNLFAYIISVFLFISCELPEPIYFLNHIEVDYQAQEVILTTDADITNNVGYVFSETDTEKPGEKIFDKNYWIVKGDWFTITVNKSQPRRVLVTLQENTTDIDRKVVVFATSFLAKDYATIVQKAKLAE